jgi:hypothetical protein
MHVKLIGIKLNKENAFNINGYRMVLFSFIAIKHQYNFELRFGSQRLSKAYEVC